MSTTITVVDAVMGSGKTTWAINRMNESVRRLFDEDEGGARDERFIFVTPLLSEVERIKAACPGLMFTDPKPVDGRKICHLNDLIREGRNIVTTHALFLSMSPETKAALRERRYTLVIDEETECVREYPMKPSDMQILLREELVTVDERKRLRWNESKYPGYDGKCFEDVKRLCDNGNLILAAGDVLIWEFPFDFLRLFGEVWILTYMFEGSYLSSYLKAHRMAYITRTLSKEGELVDMSESIEEDIMARVRDLITIIDDKNLNDIGTPSRGTHENPFSASWCARDVRNNGGRKLRRAKDKLRNFVVHRCKAKSSEVIWTCLNDYEGRLRGDGYARSHVPWTTKGTNEFGDRKYVAYMLNVFPRPRLVSYFNQNGVDPNQELYALSNLVQWVWRSQIRNGRPIVLYIPSERMRKLFRSWLFGESTQAVPKAA
jgi:hypothetical protein